MALPQKKDRILNMVDVSGKEKNLRIAAAEGFIVMEPDTLGKVIKEETPKGDVLALAKVAGILAAKKTSDLIPMCHNIGLTHCDIEFMFEEKGIKVLSWVKTIDRTGVEMEALTAVSVTLLNIYDMLKPLDKSMIIQDVKLLKKTGGKSGDFVRKD